MFGQTLPASIATTQLPAADPSPEVQSAIDFSSLFLAYMSSRNAGVAGTKTDPSSDVQQSGKRRRRGRKRAVVPRVVKPVVQSEEPKVIVDPRKYKTRMCNNWETMGFCPYEHTCCFAHGPEELRDLVSNHKLLASIGYFSNVILLSMSNGEKPALPPHALYEQPPMFQIPQTANELHTFTQALPKDVRFPYQDILPAALERLQNGTPSVNLHSSSVKCFTHRDPVVENSGI
jgi:hypothetical protein